jgi:hypothetical protein
MTSLLRLPLAGAALGLVLLALVNACAGFGVLALGTAAMSLGMAPEAVARAFTALGGALAAMRSVGGGSGNELVDAAREAFVWSLHGGSGLGAALATAAAVLALRLLRRPDWKRPFRV